MRTLSIDIETFSDVDLKKCGVYKYASSPAFEILLFGYAVDGGAVQVVDLDCGEKIPDEVVAALSDASVTKWAFNAMFERVCLSNYLGEWLEPESWHCTMVWSATLGLPLSLEGVGAVLGLEKQKLTEGKDLIRYFCVPCKPTKANGGRTRNLPEHDREKWGRFKAYNLRDVETEMQIQQKLSKFPVPEKVWEEYCQDQEINDRGIGVDMELVRQAIAMDERSKSELSAAMQRLTDLENPNSVQQMKQWLAKNGLETDSLDKKAVAEFLKTAPEPLRKVLTLRQQLARSSVKKYTVMENAVCKDSRARGMFRFYGGNRTGRYSGKIIQLQNLPQNHMTDLAQARELVRDGNYEALSLLYEDIPDTLSQLIRTAFVPQEGRKLIVADFSAIEARVIAWFAGERWRLKVFEDGGDIYCASASQMFHVPVEKHGVNGHLRQKGKIAELALGYGGSVGALKSMGALEMGYTMDGFRKAVKAAMSGTSGNTSGYTKIMGTAVATAEQMKAYLKGKNPSVAQSVLDMIPLYLSEGKTEGVRGDIAFAQSCLETGNFTFSGSAVTLDQNNFCGMGVTSNGLKGNSFDTPQLGIRAQIQHLKAYASTESLKNPCIDPRFKYVTRGCAEYVEWLGQQENPDGKGWAAGAGYGAKILSILKVITGTSGGASSSTEVWYRVRKTWTDAASQKGAFHSLDNAKRCADENAGYSVFDESGKALYTSQAGFTPYLVKVSISDLNIRKGPGTNYAKTGKYTGKGVFTIVEEADGQGASQWGLLKSYQKNRDGWISLDYGKRV